MIDSVRTLTRRLGGVASQVRIVARASNTFLYLEPDRVVAKVARKRSPADAWVTFGNEVNVTGFLVRRGCAVAVPGRTLPPGPHRQNGHVVSLREPVSGSRRGKLRDAARSLRGCHEALVGFEPRGVALDARAELTARPTASPGAHFLPGERDLLTAAVDRLGSRLTQVTEQHQPIHGDAHLGNTVQDGPECRWLDREDTVSGHPAWDIATLVAGPLVAGVRWADCVGVAQGGYGRRFADLVALFVTLRVVQHEVWSVSVNSRSHARRLARQRWIEAYLRRGSDAGTVAADQPAGR